MDRHSQLRLEPEEMRRLGYRVIDSIIDHLETLEDQPVTAPLSRAEAEAMFRSEPPDNGADPMDVLEEALTGPLKQYMKVDHPRFFAYVPCAGNFVSTMADLLASGLGVFNGSWQASPGPSQIEIVVTDWLAKWCGFPAEAGGVLVSGGSAANLTALAAARIHKVGETTDEGVVYFSDQTHSSVERGLLILGFDKEHRCSIQSDERQQIDVDALKVAIAKDRQVGRKPFCVIANAGTTTSGAVDPLETLADLCQAEDLWLHVDGAYGAAAVISPSGRDELVGLGRADSITIDPHKWLYQNVEMGCVLVRDHTLLRDAFQILPAYLEGIHRDQEEVNFCDHGIQLTRSFRALKLWMSMKVFGLDTFKSTVERGFGLARKMEELIERSPDWDLVTPARMGILTFSRRHLPSGLDAADYHSSLARSIYEDGYAMLSGSLIGDRPVLRCCTIHPRTSEEDLVLTLARLDHLADQLKA